MLSLFQGLSSNPKSVLDDAVKDKFSKDTPKQ